MREVVDPSVDQVLRVVEEGGHTAGVLTLPVGSTPEGVVAVLGYAHPPEPGFVGISPEIDDIYTGSIDITTVDQDVPLDSSARNCVIHTVQTS